MAPFEPGQCAETRRTFSAADLAEYAALVGAPVRDHVPGPLIGGMFSELLGTTLPGFGTNYLKQQLTFEDAAMAGEELTASVEIIRVRPDKHLVNLRTICLGAHGRVVCQGEALVLITDVR